jgi:hypothetical protein
LAETYHNTLEIFIPVLEPQTYTDEADDSPIEGPELFQLVECDKYFVSFSEKFMIKNETICFGKYDGSIEKITIN